MNFLKKIILAGLLTAMIAPYASLPLEAQAQDAGSVSRATTRAAKIAAAEAWVVAATARLKVATAAQFDPRIGVVAPGSPLWVADFGMRDAAIAEAAEELAMATKALADASAEVAGDILDILEKVLFESLKKKILDMMVDQIIGYIQGEGAPRFITDWEGFFGDIAQGAVGDLAQALGAGFLCSPFSLKIKLSLLLPPVERFQTNFTCTLDQIVGNIENFYSDFRNGGWVAYEAAWSPQNNYYGALWLAWDAKQNTIASKLFASANEAVANAGFLGVKQCDENGENCRTVTPGKVLGDLVGKAVGSDIDFLVNAEDLSTYVAAIANALVNRIVREGVGLAGVSLPSQPQRVRTRQEINGVVYGSANLPADVRSTVNQYSASISDGIGEGTNGVQVAATSKNTFIEQLKLIRDVRSEAQPYLTERLALEKTLLTKLQAVATCEKIKTGISAIFDAKVTAQQKIVDDVTKQANNNQTVVNDLNRTIDGLTPLNEAQFAGLGVTIQASAISDAISFRASAKSSRDTAVQNVPIQVGIAENDLAACNAR